jgi:hypothetical protein
MTTFMLISRVLIKVVVFGIFCLSVSGTMRAADNRATFAPKPLDIHVLPSPENLRQFITRLAAVFAVKL